MENRPQYLLTLLAVKGKILGEIWQKVGIQLTEWWILKVLKIQDFRQIYFFGVEERLSMRHFSTFHTQKKEEHPYWRFPTRDFLKSWERIKNWSDLSRVGFATLLKDRGTCSTMVYQGMDDIYGDAVRQRIKVLYDRNFLVRENMTLLVLPHDKESLNTDPDERDRDELDQYNRLSDVERYSQLRENCGVFSDKLVVIKNDPTGKKGTLSSTSMLAALLVVAEEQRAQGTLIELEEGRYVVNFPLYKVCRRLDRLESQGFVGFFDSVFMESRRDSNNKYAYLNGDVGIVKIDQNSVEMVIEPDLEDKITKRII